MQFLMISFNKDKNPNQTYASILLIQYQVVGQQSEQGHPDLPLPGYFL